MKVSVEISMYPLTEQYAEHVDAFIYGLQQQGDFELQTNHMSTQVFGDYDQVMGALQKQMKIAFQKGQASFAIKILSTDLREKVDLTKFNQE